MGSRRVARRAERVIRAATLISCARNVLVVALPWNRPARAPMARVRLNAIAASANQAELAMNDAERQRSWTWSSLIEPLCSNTVRQTARRSSKRPCTPGAVQPRIQIRPGAPGTMKSACATQRPPAGGRRQGRAKSRLSSWQVLLCGVEFVAGRRSAKVNTGAARGRGYSSADA